MKRITMLVVTVLCALASFSPARAEEPATAGFLWEPNDTAMQMPVSATHSVWPDRILAMESDGARIHSLWADVGGTPGTVYRGSSDGTTWSAPETIPGMNPTALAVLRDGTVFAIGDSMQLARRASSGTWTGSSTPVTQNAYLIHLAAAPDGRLWAAYTTDPPWASHWAIKAMSRDPAGGAWTAPESTGMSFDDFRYDIFLTVAADGTPWIANAAQSSSIPVFHRTSSGWVSTPPAAAGSGGSHVAVAFGPRADGSLMLVYWEMLPAVSPTLMWATHDENGWVSRGSVLGRTTVLLARARLALASNGDNVFVWEETRSSKFEAYRVASRLSPAGVWTPATVIGSFPRGTRQSLSLAIMSSGRAVLGTDSANITGPEPGGMIATEQSGATWSDEAPAGRAVPAWGPPVALGMEFAAGPNDAQFVTWFQQTGDGLDVPLVARTPHIVFALRDRTGAWSSPRVIDVGTPWRERTFGADLEAGVAGIASNTSGTAYVIWRDVHARADMTLETRMLGRLRTPDGTWTPIEHLPTSWPLFRDREYRPQMVFDPSGRLWVMDPYGQEMMRAPGGMWTLQPSLVGNTNVLLDARMVVAPDGTQYAQYSVNLGTTPGSGEVLLSQRAPDGAWSTPERVDSGTPVSRHAGGLMVAGQTLVSTWSEQVQNQSNPYAWRGMLATRGLQPGPWSAPTIFATENGKRFNDIAAMADGSWWAVYETCGRKADGNINCPYTGSAVRASQRTPDGRWLPAVFISPPQTAIDDSERPRIIGDRRPIVVWGALPYGNYHQFGPTGASFSTGYSDASIGLTQSNTDPHAGDCITSTLSVTSSDGHPLSGLEVAWITSPNIWSGGRFVINGISQTQTCVTEAKAVRISVIFTQGNPTVSSTVTWAPGEPASIRLTATVSPKVGTQASITAVVNDRFGNPTPADLEWRKAYGPGEIVSAPTRTADDGTGTARVSATETGDMGVDVSVPGTAVTGTAIVSWLPGPPVALRFVDPPSTAKIASVVSLTARTVDQFGNHSPLLNGQVIWSWSGQGAFAGAPLTNPRGDAMAVGTSVLAGDSVITATLRSSGASISTKLTWT